MASTLISLMYIYRTSFVVDGERVFCLWDDAMVSMRYARNLAMGNGLVWNAAASPVQGFSNLGITLVMAAIQLLPVPRATAPLVFQLINLSLVLYAAHRAALIARRIFASDLAALIASTAMAINGTLWVHALQGTDVPAVCAILLSAVDLALRDEAARAPWGARAYVLLAVGIVVRLDMAVIAAAFLLGSLWFDGGRRSALLGTTILVAAICAVLGAQYVYYGDALPNTYYLKLTGTPLPLMLGSGLRQLLGTLRYGVPVLLLAAAVLAVWHRYDRRLWFLGMLTLGVCAYDVRAGGDWMPYMSRFLSPVLPLMTIGIAGAFVTFLDRVVWPAPTRPNRLTALLGGVAGVLVVTASLTSWTASGEWFGTGPGPMHKAVQQEHVRFAAYLGTHTTSEAVVAVHWAGTIGYFLERTLVDVLGKSDRHIARTVTNRFEPGHSKNDWRYVVGVQRPDIIDFPDAPDKMAGSGFDEYYRRVSDGPVEFYLRTDSKAYLGQDAQR